MKLTINTNETVGRIKPMHAAGQPPLGGRGKNFFEHFHYLTEIGTPFSRPYSQTLRAASTPP